MSKQLFCFAGAAYKMCIVLEGAEMESTEVLYQIFYI